LRILILSQWYSPEPEMKVHVLARDLVARGHTVTTVTGFPNYPQGRIYPGYRQSLWSWESKDGVRVLRLPLFPDHSLSAVRRSLNYLSFALSASVLGTLLCGQADVMWVYHPPLTIGLPAMVISTLRRIPMVYEVQDMWPETLSATGMVADGLTTRALATFAKWVYRKAVAITVISPGFRRNLVSKGVAAEKVFVVPNWADEDVYHPVQVDDTVKDRFGMLGRFNVVYAGNMGPAQQLQTVVDAAGRLSAIPDILFTFAGDGVEEQLIRERVGRAGLSNVQFLGRRPTSEMPSLFCAADVLLFHLKDDPLFAITIPSKTISYLACGRPILAAVRGDAADVVQNASAGLTCPPEDPVALADAVLRLYQMDRGDRERMGQAGRRAFLKQYSRRVLLDRYESLFAALATKHQGR
jgi:colanic acid biosynthesis glycosyl transferase WcaI